MTRRRKRTAPIHAQVRVTPELRERLDRFIEERGWSITQIINEGIQRVVDETNLSAQMAQLRQEMVELRAAFVRSLGKG